MLALSLHELPLCFLSVLPHLPWDEYALAKLLLGVLDEVPIVQIEIDNKISFRVEVVCLVELPPILLDLFGFVVLVLLLGELTIDWSPLVAELSWRLALVLDSPMTSPVFTRLLLTADATQLVSAVSYTHLTLPTKRIV